MLALLIERPSYGYELRERCRRRVGSFLALGDTRIYQALNVLRDRNMIEPLDPPAAAQLPPKRQRQIQGRRHFTATAEGKRKLERWLTTQTENSPTDTQLLARITAASALGPQTLQQTIERHQAQCDHRAEELTQQTNAEPSPQDAEFAITASLIAEQQRLAIQAQQTWCEIALRTSFKKSGATGVHGPSWVPRAGEARAGGTCETARGDPAPRPGTKSGRAGLFERGSKQDQRAPAMTITATEIASDARITHNAWRQTQLTRSR